MTTHQVYNSLPYCGLPDFPGVTGKTAMVVGANGISGQYMLRVLSQHPQRWNKIYSISRRPATGVSAPQITHISVDLLGGVEGIKRSLTAENGEKITADYIFFFAYKETPGEKGELWGGQEQMVQENSEFPCLYFDLMIDSSSPDAAGLCSCDGGRFSAYCAADWGQGVFFSGVGMLLTGSTMASMLGRRWCLQKRMILEC